MDSLKTISFLVLIYSFNGFSQPCSIWVTGFNQNKNIAYLGVNNGLEFENDTRLTKALGFEANNGEVFTDSYGYKYRPAQLGRSTIRCFDLTNSQKELVGVCQFEVKYLPFTLELGAKSFYYTDQLEVWKNELLVSCFYMHSTNTNLSANAVILGFKVTVRRGHEIIFEHVYDRYNREVDNKLKKELEILKPNDIVHINELYYSYMTDHLIPYKPISIKVK